MKALAARRAVAEAPGSTRQKIESGLFRDMDQVKTDLRLKN
jgi:hypothetical protein